MRSRRRSMWVGCVDPSASVSVPSPLGGEGQGEGARAYAVGTARSCSCQHVAGAVHTNTIEGFWSIFKRGVVGTFHKVSRKYMTLYVAEFQFRYNNRLNADIFGAR